MSIFKNIMTAIRGGATEVGETIVDSQAERILAQSIRDVKEEIKKSTLSVAQLDAKRKACEKEVLSLRQKKADALTLAKKYKDAENIEKAKEVLSALNQSVLGKLTSKETQLTSLEKNLVKVRADLETGKNNLIEFEDQFEITKTQMQINQISKEASASTINSSTASSNMKETLQRFKTKSENEALVIESLDEMENEKSDLDSLLASDKTKDSVDDMLNNL